MPLTARDLQVVTPDTLGVQALKTRLNALDGAEMVYVPAGEFLMGSNNGLEDERPAHRVRISRPFWIYRTPVTNAQYRLFVDAVAHRPPPHWEKDGFNAPEQPVVEISWNTAREYCAWADVSLPTEAQWEYAARGADGREFPWGNEPPDATRAVFSAGQPATVGGRAAGASPFGALDMSGNVWEWCIDWFAPYPMLQMVDPTGPEAGKARIFRGGSWVNTPYFLRAAYRYKFDPVFRSNNLGFRPVMPAL